MLESGLNIEIGSDKTILDIDTINRYWKPLTNSPYTEFLEFWFPRGVGYIDPAIEFRTELIVDEFYNTKFYAKDQESLKQLLVYYTPSSGDTSLTLRKGEDICEIWINGEDVEYVFTGDMFATFTIEYNEETNLLTIRNFNWIVDDPSQSLEIKVSNTDTTFPKLEFFDMTNLGGCRSLDLALLLWGAIKRNKIIFNSNIGLSGTMVLPNYSIMFDGRYNEIKKINSLTYIPFSTAHSMMETGDIIIFKQGIYYHTLFVIDINSNLFTEVSAEITVDFGAIFNAKTDVFQFESRYKDLSEGSDIRLIKMK